MRAKIKKLIEITYICNNNSTGACENNVFYRFFKQKL